MKLVSSSDSSDHLAQILDITKKPNGFSKLSSVQRRFLLAAVLASVIPADRRIHAKEVERYKSHLKIRYQFPEDALQNALSLISHVFSQAQLVQAAAVLPEILSIEDRVYFIWMMWDLALCDHMLHSSEEEIIYLVADRAGVPRKRVAEEQARAMRMNAMPALSA